MQNCWVAKLQFSSCLKLPYTQHSIQTLNPKPHGWMNSWMWAPPCYIAKWLILFIYFFSVPSGFCAWLKASRRTSRAAPCWRRRPERRRRPDCVWRSSWLSFRPRKRRRRRAPLGAWAAGTRHQSVFHVTAGWEQRRYSLLSTGDHCPKVLAPS